jgi:hypothetical protein
MTLTCRWRSRPQHQNQTFQVPLICERPDWGPSDAPIGVGQASAASCLMRVRHRRSARHSGPGAADYDCCYDGGGAAPFEAPQGTNRLALAFGQRGERKKRYRMPNPASRPVAACTGCGTFASSRASIGQPCGASVAPRTRRCEGVFLVVAPEDWQACRLCSGTGKIEHVGCERCQGTGWEQAGGTARR